MNLADDDNLVGDWQQDRWSNGGSSGNLSAYSLNGGTSWTIPPISSASDTGQAKFSRCTGGNAANGGDFERATDPWVSFSPNGVAHQVALGINDSNVANAVLTSRSSDKGANWEDPVVVKFDDRARYNGVHRHSGIGLMTPADVHHGRADAVHAGRVKHAYAVGVHGVCAPVVDVGRGHQADAAVAMHAVLCRRPGYADLGSGSRCGGGDRRREVGIIRGG